MPERGDPLRHHDLCFGCGQANLFGLQLELERTADGGVEGRFFVKQDHQGPDGSAHPGVLVGGARGGTALVAGQAAGRLEVELLAPAGIGSFVEVTASERIAVASGADGQRLAVARLDF